MKTFQDGLKRDCDADGNVLWNRLTDRESGMRFEDFVTIGEERGMHEQHVLALRLYTTKAYQSINTQLRDEDRRRRGEAFPFPVTVYYVEEALSQLRYDEQGRTGANQAFDLWRGMRDAVS